MHSITPIKLLSPLDIQQEIIQEFQFLGGDREFMLQYLIELGETLPTFPETEKTEQNRIQGCMSTVWLSCKPEGGKLYLQADSNTAITKGLISLLVRVLSGQYTATILRTELYFLEQIGMNQLIGSQRSSGLANMIQQIRKLATAQLAVKCTSVETYETLEARVIEAITQVHDPEIPVNIYDLGLIYQVDVDDEQHVHIQMTLTSPGCPVAQTFPGTVEQTVNQLSDVSDCTVELVWEPPWTQERMTEVARLELGMFF
jgi:FeS assembly SUF system protein